MDRINKKELASLLRSANWQALQNPSMEYRITQDMESGELRVTEWPEHSSNYFAGDRYIYTCCHWPGCSGNRCMEQHAFVEQIPNIIRYDIGIQ